MYKNSEQYYEMKYYKYKAKIQKLGKLKGGSKQETKCNLSDEETLEIYYARQNFEGFITKLNELQFINPRLLFDYLTKTIRYKQNNIARTLVIKGLEIGVNILEDESNVSVLLPLACKNNNLEGLELIFEFNENTDVNCRDSYGSTPLIIACENQNIDIVKRLLEKGANVAIEYRGDTPILTSIIFFNMEIFRLLLERSSYETINRKYENNNTILHFVLKNRKTLEEHKEEILRLLLDNGAIENFNEANGDGETIFYLACHYDLFNVVIILLEYEPRYHAFLRRNLRAIEPINIVNIACGGNTPLYIACRNGNIELVTHLLQNGADASINEGNNNSDDNVVKHYNHYNLRHRRIMRHTDELDYILEDYNGHTPLFIAYIKNDRQLVELLLRYGATPDIPQLSEFDINYKVLIFECLNRAERIRIYGDRFNRFNGFLRDEREFEFIRNTVRIEIDAIIIEQQEQNDIHKKGAKC